MTVKTLVSIGVSNAIKIAKLLLKYLTWLIAFFFAVFIYGRVSAYLEDRSFKKAQTEEYFRRQHMTSEQRLAEDQAREKEAAERIVSAKVKAVRKGGELVCKATWLDQLKDPYSAKIEEFNGSVDRKTLIFYADIYGRAKNSFGAYVPGNWVCTAYMQENGKMKVTHLSEIK